MTFVSGLVTASVTGNVSTSFPGLTSGTLKCSGMHGLNGGAQTVATVTAGKTAYVYGMTFTHSAAGSADLKNPADAVIYMSIRTAAAGSSSVFSSTPFAVYQAGENIRTYGTNTAGIILHYVEY